MVKRESYAVIGLGQFGSSICEALVQAGQEVLAIDSNEEVINEYSDSVMRAVIADAQDEDVLRDLDIGSFDHIYVSIGKNVEASIMVTLIAKELGAKDVICRAENANHARVLEKIGADQVVRPEHDLAKRLVFQQLNPGVVDYVQLSKEVTLAEVNINNPKFFGKTLDELDFRNRYNVNVIIIVNENDQVNQMPQANDVIKPHDKVTVVGDLKDIKKLNSIVA
ncbi:potassium channel family protein [Limosilactobacillus fastidiosus]|uniref:TrkA family potassium uptake protein n=1 Tax=Limosilactobacillus fastidiosus TaxID=2759855 RepID=A0A7W3YC75_9LACO|nr:TrkA family potassium uptake protein [Limosilactobacillus fastidiosus]MBB1063399.1 TrkA family potassium uptake protein [Limosilactobacillus fastidiosus]MBB1085920.1 TrkA family potassium uptake protein [Limosilactobacillus fastidiosus]MCD7084667.1 TrkA family potassium uptake protein [Limosilactobacillus fastidiosus]MCD7085743.1 TrkA family potassium uptake protein [Limosilactobacillus fastidiosus]MCD7113820.1 TrkA family potassium uptake protein [Limosilactobacillus fastidiosus]